MCPTLLGQAHERNGIFNGFGIGLDKRLDKEFDKPIYVITVVNAGKVFLKICV